MNIISLTVTDGYNGGAKLRVSVDGVQQFEATGDSPYNLAFTPNSGTVSTPAGDLLINILGSATSTTPLSVILTGVVEESLSIPYAGMNTSYGYNYSNTWAVEPPPPPPTGDVVLVLQYSASENNRVDKDLTEIATYSGTLRQSTSIIDPVFIVECSLPDVIGANYLTVEAFGRSYFIKNITSHRAGLVEFSCHVDVLSSFKTQLRTNRAIVHRSEKNWNLYLNDGSLKVKQTPKVTTQEFPGSFGNSYSFILVLAG